MLDFVTQDNLKELSTDWNVSTFEIIEAIKKVGRCKDDVLEYLENSSTALALKDSDFKINYTALMIKNKNCEIEALNRCIKQDKIIIDTLNQKIEKLEKSNSEIKFPFIREYTTDKYTQYQVIYEKGGIVSTCCFRDNREEAVAFLNYLKDTQKE